MDAVTLSAGSEGLRREDLAGFFVDWPHPPTLDDRLAILRSADEVVVCTTADGLVVGFATAITDRRFAAYIPLVEVLPEYQVEASDHGW
jgi:L-amino acid N-acyltransferase YncA